mmetsp:Transcript_15840/g.36388  ORF Transcript_15840/g.36388 Transcript_15840/m.36388 type:complete len:115 (+) Transcript_15840:371-715(+)|eukprot:CAMPEP_0116826280 /NCGR_PEP_ID=MMETSP0418-20121206/2444_1 /TAXON_ID=1158023 /ORGANISM="Astrosyne radiata, Strain 13vi08-1A" /LENGTH=114 /DNA_ID=CAMNT_0004454903 /DNA_START=288 /DNA_END=635 /DNA_ORIENTATION=-
MKKYKIRTLLYSKILFSQEVRPSEDGDDDELPFCFPDYRFYACIVQMSSCDFEILLDQLRMMRPECVVSCSKEKGIRFSVKTCGVGSGDDLAQARGVQKEPFHGRRPNSDFRHG